jgi:hypothetical protein
MNRIGLRLTLCYFLLTGLWGVIMRSVPMGGLQVNYDYLLHAHSHVAILGWCYSGLYLLMVRLTNGGSALPAPKGIVTVFWLTQASIIGMFIAFNLQGYALFSIAFSTVHILLSYVFIGMMWGRLRSKAVHYRFFRAALLFLGISSIGPWSLAVTAANGMKGSPLYDMAIYFYLHFQYNGWLTLGLLGVVLALLERWGIRYDVQRALVSYRLYVWSLVPAFMLSILWYGFGLTGELIGLAAGLAQFAAIAVFLNVLYRVRGEIASQGKGWAQRFALAGLAFLAIKAILELGSAVPVLTPLIYETRSVIIGYLHLTLLGFISFLLLGLLMRLGWIDERGRWIRTGSVLLLGGFVLNEAVLFLQGLFDWMEWNGGALPNSLELLLAASILMTAGIVAMVIHTKEGTEAGLT